MHSTGDELAALWALARQDDPGASADQIAAVVVELIGPHRVTLPDVRRFVDELERSDNE